MLVAVKLDDIAELKPIAINGRDFLPCTDLSGITILQYWESSYYAEIVGSWADTGQSDVMIVRITDEEIVRILPPWAILRTPSVYQIVITYLLRVHSASKYGKE